MTGCGMLTTSREGRVLTLTVDFPAARNAVSRELSEALGAATRAAASDSDIGAIIRTGAGETFSADGDLRKLAASLDEPPRRHGGPARPAPDLDRGRPRVGRDNQRRQRRRRARSAAACDIRIGLRAKLAFAYPHVGLAGDFAVSWSLTRILGHARARHFCLLSEVLGARRACEISLVHEVHLDDLLAARAMSMAQRAGESVGRRLEADQAEPRCRSELPSAQALEIEASNFLAARTHPITARGREPSSRSALRLRLDAPSSGQHELDPGHCERRRCGRAIQPRVTPPVGDLWPP